MDQRRSARELIVNADDFGRSLATNEGVAKSREHGIVTSASLMVHWPGAPAAAAYARSHPDLSIGLHVDLSAWVERQHGSVGDRNRGRVAEEISGQLAAFRVLMGRDPTHLDSHHHIHRSEPVASLLAELAARLHLPLREAGSIAYRGDFYGKTGLGEPDPAAISPEALVTLVEGLAPGVTELGCHPGLDARLASSYRAERLREVGTLCDPWIRAAIDRAGVTLRSF